jgi:hypothetical protein
MRSMKDEIVEAFAGTLRQSVGDAVVRRAVKSVAGTLRRSPRNR